MTLKGVQVGDEIEVTFAAFWNKSCQYETERYIVGSISPGNVVRAVHKRPERGSKMNKLSFTTANGRCVSYSGISAKKVTA